MSATQILTAAHCFERPYASIRVDVAVDLQDPSSYQYSGHGVSVAVNGDYLRSQASGDDLAVITLDNPIPFGNGISPAVFADHNPRAQEVVRVMGNGARSIGDVSRPDFVDIAENLIVPCSNARTICAQGISSEGIRAHTCIGDSGGPGQLSNGLVFGVLSGGSLDCATSRSSIDRASFASAFHNKAWIQENAPGAKFSNARPQYSRELALEQPAPRVPAQRPARERSRDGCYVVKRSDSSYEEIARRHGVNLNDFLTANAGRIWNVGHQLILPGRPQFTCN